MMIWSFWIKTALCFLVRSRRATLALGLMIFFAVATLIFIGAVAVGINDCMIRNSIGLYSGQITGSQLGRIVTKESLKKDGVLSVLERFSVSSILEHDKKKQQITMIAVHPDQELKSTVLWEKILNGRYLQNNSHQVLISSDTAQMFGIQPGGKLILKSESHVYSVTVSGIFKTGMDRFDKSLAFCPVSIFSKLPEKWDCAIFTAPGADMKQILNAYELDGIDRSLFKTWKEQMPDLTQLIDLNQISMGFIMVLVLGVVAFGTACAFAIFIISHIREYGIMKAMGVTRFETTFLIFSQVMLLNIISAAAGTLTGMAAVWAAAETGIDISTFTSHNPYFVVSGVIIPRSTFFSLVLPSILTLFFCLFSAVWPVMIVARQQSCDILRSV